MKWSLLILFPILVMAKNPIIQTDCEYKYLPNGVASEDSTYMMKTFLCGEGDQKDIKWFPAKIFKKYKQDGAKRISVVHENGVPVKTEFIENEIVYTTSTYFIPNCRAYQSTWRLQVAAISDPNKSANELFFKKIEDVISSCEIPNDLISTWSFCKTSGEEFGAHENPGTNKTSRLYLQLNQFDMSLSSPEYRSELVKSCRINTEGKLGRRLQACIQVEDQDEPKMLIIPPKDFVNKYFNILDDKLQFESCDNLETSSHLVPKT